MFVVTTDPELGFSTFLSSKRRTAHWGRPGCCRLSGRKSTRRPRWAPAAWRRSRQLEEEVQLWQSSWKRGAGWRRRPCRRYSSSSILFFFFFFWVDLSFPEKSFFFSSSFWQADEAREHCKACQVDVSVKRVDLANTKSEIITQIREMVSQCDLTLKAVSSENNVSTDKESKKSETQAVRNSSLQVTVNWFQLQQAQVVSLPINHQSLCENAKQYEPGQRYIDFVRSLPTEGPRLESHSLDSPVAPNAWWE